ncbi:MAG: MltA domain-containing protein [Geminicoccaceae bacterium]
MLAVAGCKPKPEKPSEATLVLEPTKFAHLDDWDRDDHAAALAVFAKACTKLLARDPTTKLGKDGFAGTVADWQPVCADAATTAPGDAKSFFERELRPYRLTDRGNPKGLFTGYYEPVLRGARAPDTSYRWPLYGRPGDLIDVDLGDFDPDLKGKKVTGRVEGTALVPYPDRAAIDGGALDGKGLELLWVDDAVERFFLEIQGSGQIRLADGTRTRVGYADQNGRPYRAIGRDLVEMGALTKDEVSMQAIRDWLHANPDQAAAVMAKNPSYVFFRELPELADNDGPIGAQGLPLTAGRSLAVDRRFLPMGMPIWLQATMPSADGDEPLHRLFVTQDTGGAIRGIVRGDVFWGSGDEAGHLAGHMKSEGAYYILLPATLSPAS